MLVPKLEEQVLLHACWMYMGLFNSVVQPCIWWKFCFRASVSICAQLNTHFVHCHKRLKKININP